MLRPLGDRVIVDPVVAPKQSPGGIVLPDAAQEKSQRGMVTAVGSGRILLQGGYQPVDLDVGDEVLFSPYSGTDVELDGKTVKILKEDEVLAVVEKR